MGFGRVVALGCLLALAGCRCTPPLVTVEPAGLVATPTQLALGPAYVGQQALGVVSVVNEGGATAVAAVSIDGSAAPQQRASAVSAYVLSP